MVESSYLVTSDNCFTTGKQSCVDTNHHKTQSEAKVMKSVTGNH